MSHLINFHLFTKLLIKAISLLRSLESGSTYYHLFISRYVDFTYVVGHVLIVCVHTMPIVPAYNTMYVRRQKKKLINDLPRKKTTSKDIRGQFSRKNIAQVHSITTMLDKQLPFSMTDPIRVCLKITNF